MLAPLHAACAARPRGRAQKRSLPATDLVRAGALVPAFRPLALAMLSAAALLWAPAGA